MLAEILTIGDELCRGEVVDTNSSWLAAELWDLDVTCSWLTSCRDHPADMAKALAKAVERADLVVCSGGLGPTIDDLTVDVVAQMAGVAAEVHEPSRQRMEARYRVTGSVMTETSLRQVRTPVGASVIDNPVGIAPGFWIDLCGTPVLCMPGVPSELHAIFTAGGAPRIIELREAGGDQVERVARTVVRVFGRGESHVANILEGVIDGVEGASLHYQVPFPETLVKLVVRDRDAERAAAHLSELVTEVRGRLGTWAYGEGDTSLAQAMGSSLTDAGLTLATAESCTGGMVGQLVTQVAGSSAYYLGGAVCYANREKVRQLGVSETTLAEHGAVSEPCAVEMAAGIRKRAGADIGVAVTGIAGPGGGSADKPVGTVWLAVSGPGEHCQTRRMVWPGSRDHIRRLASYWAMAMVRYAAQRPTDGQEAPSA